MAGGGDFGASLMSSFWSYVCPPKPGQDEDHPLELLAVPGLTTLLDVALFRSVEGQLTATICSSHALVWAWLDLKHQSQQFLSSISNASSSSSTTTDCYGGLLDNANNHESSASHIISSRKLLAESFARQCLEAASDALERLSTDKLAHSANLSDPYDSTASGGSSTGATGHTHHHHNFSSSGSTSLSGVGWQGIVSGIIEGKEETGRRYPTQSRRDCWESPRLLCPDHVWADDSFLACQRLLRNLSKHPYITVENDVDTSLSLPSGMLGGNAHHHHQSSLLSSLSNPNTSSSVSSYLGSSSSAAGMAGGMSPACERQVALLVQLVQDDLPIRLYHFRNAMEAESVVTKRLYLVKCEYRAPFRAFLEAHQSVQRAPSMTLVDHYLSKQRASNDSNKKESSSSSSSSSEKELSHLTRETSEAKLKSLLETPILIESLALEKECEELEIEMGRALFPFSELGRSLDRRARLKLVPGILSEPYELYQLQDTVRRLKCILCRKGGPETSTGIRPILLDLQGVPRDDEAILAASRINRELISIPVLLEKLVSGFGGGNKNTEHKNGTAASNSTTDNKNSETTDASSKANTATATASTDNNASSEGRNSTAGDSNSSSIICDERVEQRLDEFLQQLKLLGTLCKTRNAFKTEKRNDVDFLTSSVVKGCTEFDDELFRCQFLDWHVLVQRQHAIHSPSQDDDDEDIKDDGNESRGQQNTKKEGSVDDNDDNNNKNNNKKKEAKKKIETEKKQSSTSTLLSLSSSSSLLSSIRLDDLAEQIRCVEMERSISIATKSSLEMVKQRLEMIALDRSKRFGIVKEMVEEVCLREMNLHVLLKSPNPQRTLKLAETSAIGFLGIPLQLSGEPLPVG